MVHPDTRWPLGVSGQAPGICGSACVILHSNRGTKMDHEDKKNDYKETSRARSLYIENRRKKKLAAWGKGRLRLNLRKAKGSVPGIAGLWDTESKNNSRGRARRELCMPLLAWPVEMQKHPRLRRTVRLRQLTPKHWLTHTQPVC